MKLQDLSPDAQCLPEATALLVLSNCKRRLADCDLQNFVKEKTSQQISMIVDTSKIEVDTLLGKGSFCAVYAMDNRFAVKVLQPKLLETPLHFAKCAANLVREGMMLQALQHPHIVKCHSMGEVQAFQNGRHDSCVLVLDRLRCTLKDRLDEWRNDTKQFHPSLGDHGGAGLVNAFFRFSGGAHRRMQQTILERTNILCELADAVEYLHSNLIMHRDLKPENLGLTEEGRLKVFDFDVRRILPEESSKHPDRTYRFTSKIGTRRYMAPEVAIGDMYNAKSDVYSFGLICYEVLSLKKPYGDIPAKVLTHSVVSKGLRPSVPQSWPQPTKNFVERCWHERLSSRPTMSKVLTQIQSSLKHMVVSSGRKTKSASWGGHSHDGSVGTRHTNGLDSEDESMNVDSL